MPEEILVPILIILGCFFLLYGIYLFLISPGKKNKEKIQKLAEYNYAHRGLHNQSESVPENSLAAFLLAKQTGYGVELDLHLTKDNRVVVFHDYDLKRACGVDSKIGDLTWDELCEYKIFGTDEKIPLLSEVIRQLDGKIPILAEFKYSNNYTELCKEATILLDEYKGDYCIESFYPQIVRWFYKNRPDIPRGQLSSNMRGLGKENPFGRFVVSSLLSNVSTRPDFVACFHGHAKGRIGIKHYKMLGGKLFGWTISDKETADRYSNVFDSIIFENFKPENPSG